MTKYLLQRTTGRVEIYTDLKAERPDMKEISEEEAEKAMAKIKKNKPAPPPARSKEDAKDEKLVSGVNGIDAIKDQVELIRTKNQMAVFAQENGDIEFEGEPSLKEMKELYVEAIEKSLSEDKPEGDEKE